jgi:hypothetical protein
LSIVLRIYGSSTARIVLMPAIDGDALPLPERNDITWPPLQTCLRSMTPFRIFDRALDRNFADGEIP